MKYVSSLHNGDSQVQMVSLDWQMLPKGTLCEFCSLMMTWSFTARKRKSERANTSILV